MLTNYAADNNLRERGFFDRSQDSRKHGAECSKGPQAAKGVWGIFDLPPLSGNISVLFRCGTHTKELRLLFSPLTSETGAGFSSVVQPYRRVLHSYIV